MKIMKTVFGRKITKTVEIETLEAAVNSVFWIERLFLCLLIFFPTYVSDVIFHLLLATTLIALPHFLFNPKLYSIGPSGIGGIWLFLLDRYTFFLCFEYSILLGQGIELAFLRRLTVLLSFVIHLSYIFDHFFRSHQAVPPLHDDTSTSTEEMDDDDDKEGIKEVKKLVKKLYNDMKKMKRDMNHSDIIESLKEESSKYGEKMMGRLDTMEYMIRLHLTTLRNNMCLNVSDSLEEEASRQDINKDVKSVIDSLNETYRLIQETAKEVKAKAAEDIKAARENFNKDVKLLADQLREIRFIIQKTTEEANKKIDQEDQSKSQMIRVEDIEGFSELWEEVQRLSMKAEAATDELKRTTVELVEASLQQWEEDNADYIASLPLLYCHHN